MLDHERNLCTSCGITGILHLDNDRHSVSYIVVTRTRVGTFVLAIFVEFVANNPGDWMVHCHLPHHMMNQCHIVLQQRRRALTEDKLDPLNFVLCAFNICSRSLHRTFCGGKWRFCSSAA